MFSLLFMYKPETALAALKKGLEERGCEVTFAKYGPNGVIRATNDVIKNVFSATVEEYDQARPNVNNGPYIMKQVRLVGELTIPQDLKDIGLEGVYLSRRMGLTD